MKILGYLFTAMMYVGCLGFFAVLFLVTGLRIYEFGVGRWFFGGGIEDAIGIFGRTLAQPITWFLLVLLGVGVFGRQQVDKRLPHPTPPELDDSIDDH
jgi:hypothetical protein